jgi:hypothetical protein
MERQISNDQNAIASDLTIKLLRQIIEEEFIVDGQRISHVNQKEGSSQRGKFTVCVEGDFAYDFFLDYSVKSSSNNPRMNLDKLYTLRTLMIEPDMLNGSEGKALISAIATVAESKGLEIVTNNISLGKDLQKRGLKIRTES